jgi:hypothetical protein
MQPSQGKTILEIQELPKFSKVKMKWITAYVASKEKKSWRWSRRNNFYYHQASIDYYDTSYWISGEAKNLFVPLVGESLSDCLEKRIYSMQQSNYLEASWVDVVDTYNKDGVCKPAAVFKIWQQCKLLWQAYIFALDWMNQQNDYDVPNKTWKECCEAACKHLNPCGNLAATNGETIARWNR